MKCISTNEIKKVYLTQLCSYPSFGLRFPDRFLQLRVRTHRTRLTKKALGLIGFTTLPTGVRGVPLDIA